LESVCAEKPGEASSILLARAYVEGNHPEKADSEFWRRVRRALERDFWFAQALAVLGRSGEALSAYRAAGRDPELLPGARLGEARMLRATGHAEEALDLLATRREWAGDLGLFMEFEAAMALLDLNRAGDARAVLDADAPFRQ